MPRNESPIPPGPLAPLAIGLRAARAAAGLTLRELAGKTGFSTAVLSKAASGTEPRPTWRVVEAYIEGCAANVEAARTLYDDAVASALEAEGEASAAAGGRAARKTSRQRRAGPGADLITKYLRELLAGSQFEILEVAIRAAVERTRLTKALRGELTLSRQEAEAVVEVCGGSTEALHEAWKHENKQVLAGKKNSRRSTEVRTGSTTTTHPARQPKPDIPPDPAWFSIIDKIISFKDLSHWLGKRRLQLDLTYSQITTNAKDKGARLGKSTISNMLSGDRAFERETMLNFLLGCAVSKQEKTRWRAAWNRARASVPLYQPIKDLTPAELGVRPLIGVPYIRRGVDDLLRSNLVTSTERGGLIFVYGEPDAGKTHCILESLRDCVTDWKLFRPQDRPALDRFIESPRPRTVVLLDPLVDYLPDLPGDSDALTQQFSHLHDRCGAVIVIATLTHDPAELVPPNCPKTTTGPWLVEVQPDFTPSERQQLAAPAEQDPTLAALLASGGFSTIAQNHNQFRRKVLGATVALHWKRTDAPAAAVIRAAADSALLGVRDPLPSDKLERIARIYLGPKGNNLPEGWVHKAIHDADRALVELDQWTHGEEQQPRWIANPDLLEYLSAAGYTPQLTAPALSADQELLNNNETNAAKKNAQHAGPGRFREHTKGETMDKANKRHRRAVHWIRGLLRIRPLKDKRDTRDV